jgi:hypothetical protein
MKITKDDDGEWECIGCGAGFMIKPFNEKWLGRHVSNLSKILYNGCSRLTLEA